MAIEDLASFQRALDDSLEQFRRSQPWEAGDDRSTLGNLFYYLSLLDRPRNAIATAVANLIDEDPETGALQGLKQGFMGDRHTSWGDIVGIPQATSQDAWLPWLAKSAARLGLDVVGDPLNLLFGAGAITKGLGLSSKGVSAAGRLLDLAGRRQAMAGLRGSGIGRLFSHTSGDPAVEAAIAKIQREGNLSDVFQEAARVEERLPQMLAERGITGDAAQEFIRGGLWQGLERPGAVPAVDEPIRELFRPLRERQGLTYDELERLRGLHGQPQFGRITEEGYEQMPRVPDALGRWLTGSRSGISLDPTAAHYGRTIFNWKDPEGVVQTTGRLGDPRTGLIEREGQVFYRPPQRPRTEQFHEVVDPETGQIVGREVTRIPWVRGPEVPVTPSQATMPEAAAVAGRQWIENPVQALVTDIAHKQAGINQFRLLDELNELGLLRERGPVLERGWRPLEIPGFEHLETKAPVANRLHNVLGIAADPTSWIGGLQKMAEALWKTKPGQLLEAYTRTWKRNTLALHPGWLVANGVSNLTLLYLAGVRNPARIAEAVRVQRGVGKGVIEGMDNLAARKAFEERALINQGGWLQMGEAAGPAAQLAKSQQVPFLELATAKLGPAGKPIEKVGKAIEWANDRGLALNSKIEDNARLAVAIDWLKKNIKGRRPSEAELDQAAMYAMDHMGNYGDLTVFERALRSWFPFMAWHRHIIGRTLQDLGLRPQELANIERFAQTIFTPLSPADRAIAPDWITDKGPVRGAFGYEPRSPEGLPVLGMLGRFVPHGTVEEALNRPGGTLLNLLNPVVKAPLEGLGNWSYFKGRPIDPLAEQPFAAPLTGGIYSRAQDPLLGLDLPAAYEYGLRSWTPMGRHLSAATTLGEGTLWRNPNRAGMSGAQKLAWWLTGGKLYPFDRQRALYYRNSKEGRQIAAAQTQMKRAAQRQDLSAAQHYAEMVDKLYRDRERRLQVTGGV